MSKGLRQKWEKLLTVLRQPPGWVVAFSGGCDSTFLIAAARHALGPERLLAVTAVSESLAGREKLACETLARQLDVSHRTVQTQELANPRYAANPSNRCFFCKDELFQWLSPIAKAKGYWLADGFNASDRTDVRPGRQAAELWNVFHPLDEADLFKHDIRALSRWLKLPTWSKPASPCLSSRIPYGTPVTMDLLQRIERGEAFLHAEGFRVVRLRHYGKEARIEVEKDEIARLQEPSRWSRVQNFLARLGYETVFCEPEGFRSGRLNEALTAKKE